MLEAYNTQKNTTHTKTQVKKFFDNDKQIQNGNHKASKERNKVTPREKELAIWLDSNQNEASRVSTKAQHQEIPVGIISSL